jgi:luciferase family oxidoreductase group 1
MDDQTIAIGVLDQSPVRTGGSAEQAIRETLELARVADRLGFSRYWLAEHHSTNSFACAAPEVLIPAVADATRRIRVGAGGIMLSHYSPFKVAEQFRMLEALFPGRIDLGVGRAPGGMPGASAALAYGRAPLGPDIFPAQVRDLLGWLHETLPAEHPFRRVRAMPRIASAPSVWLLGSGGETARLAAELACGYSFARFISGLDPEAPIREYLQHADPEAPPRPNIAVGVICADSDAEARHLALSLQLWRGRIARGRDRGIPSPDEAERELRSAGIPLDTFHDDPRVIAGDPDRVRSALLGIARRHAVKEIIAVTVTHSFEARVRSHELLAEALRLPSATY